MPCLEKFPFPDGVRSPAPRTSLSSGIWEPVSPENSIQRLEGSLLSHSCLVWVLLPACVALQVFIPSLAPTCNSGYTNWSLLLVLLLEIHHLWAERWPGGSSAGVAVPAPGPFFGVALIAVGLNVAVSGVLKIFAMVAAVRTPNLTGGRRVCG
eukprot:Skav225698  [mRNA]  locus=scaffold1817:161499:172308:+ [translate_table: standard]